MRSATSSLESVVGVITGVSLTSYSTRSAFTSERSRSSESISCTVYVSSFNRLPRIVSPSRVTARIGRLIGSRAALGSSSVRCNAAGVRTTPISLRSGAVRGPCPFTRWQEAQPPLPANNT